MRKFGASGTTALIVKIFRSAFKWVIANEGLETKKPLNDVATGRDVL